ncbi:MAG: MBL fold metallo-hydrolase, partial [Sphingomonadales bacterium]
MKRFFSIFLGLFVLISLPAMAQKPVYNIENVTGDLYRFQSNNHYGVFLVTKEGIILADPINTATATWLKGELDTRFGVPVKYVIYSHDHADHTSGGEVFEDTATFVAQAYALKKFQESGHTPVPQRLVLTNDVLELGGAEVDLFYYWNSHTDNLLTIYFPKEKAVFLVDAVGVKRLPYRDLASTNVNNTIFYLSEVKNLDFDILIPGHGSIGGPKDLDDHLNYLGALSHGVTRGLELGHNLETIKEDVALDDFKDWAMFEEWRELNIEGAYRQKFEKKSQPAKENYPVRIKYKN